MLDTEARQKGATAGVETWQKKLNDAQTEVVNLDRKIEKNNRYLDEAKTSADGTAKSIDNMGKEMRGAGDDAKNFGENTKTSLEDVQDVMTALGFTQLFARHIRGIPGVRGCLS